MGPRYGPGFQRVSKYESRPLSAGGSGLELVGIKEPELPSFQLDYVGKKTEEACQKYEEYVEKKAMEQSFMDADTVEDFLKHQANIQHMREMADKKEYKPLYNDVLCPGTWRRPKEGEGVWEIRGNAEVAG